MKRYTEEQLIKKLRQAFIKTDFEANDFNKINIWVNISKKHIIKNPHFSNLKDDLEVVLAILPNAKDK